MDRGIRRAPVVAAVVLLALTACASGTTVGAEPSATGLLQEAEPTTGPTAAATGTSEPTESPEAEPSPPADAEAGEWPPASTTVVHGSEKWATYVAVTPTTDDPAYTAARQRLDELGYPGGGGDIGCDRGAAEALEVTPSAIGVAVYFDSQTDAETFAEMYGPEAVGTAQVTTGCLD